MPDKDCVFCKIVSGEIPSEIIEETSKLLVFKDVNPKAPVHFLIIPRSHLKDLTEDNGVIWASIGKLAVKLAEKMNLEGFRLVHNIGSAAAVKHMHIHFLSGINVDREI